MKILLVDDDYLLAKGTAKLIERLSGHSVIIAEHPDDIVEYCQKGNVELVLMDVNLPGAIWEDQEISGADLARWLKNSPSTGHIPIILVTAYAMSTEKHALLEISQADGFVTKPITDYDALLKMIEQLGTQNHRQ